MSDSGHLPPHSGPPPGPVGRPLPPPPPPPTRATWWIALAAIGAAVVGIAAVIGIAVLARGSDDASSPTTGRPAPATTFMAVPVETAPPVPDGTTFADPGGTYTMTIGTAWGDVSDQMDPGTEAWAVAGAIDGFTPNVNVLTQDAPGADVGSLLAGSLADLERVGADVGVHSFVTAADGTELGTLRYSATAPGSSLVLSFLAVFGVRDGTAVVATLTAPPDRFMALAEEIEPHLLTLRVTG